MKFAVSSVLILATGAVFGHGARCSGSNNLTVRSSTGTYTGLIDPEYPNTLQFRAIPFAEPPFVTAVPSLYNLNYTKGNLIYNGYQNDSSGLVGEATSEDCLYLAVWTPTAAVPASGAGLPVLFFMTGGGFIIGGVDIPWQMPTSWVERSQSHIVVTINYRVDIFGFPNARGLVDGQQNLGILDQRAALEWVRDNIAAFGGDPNRITQMGRSSGAVSADIHAYAFRDDPIAQAIYMQSGTIFGASIPPKDPEYSNFSFVARHVGCENPSGSDEDEDGTAELDCMRRVPFAMIENFIGQYGDRGETPALTFKMIPDDRVVFTDYKARAEAGKLARVPYLISETANEASSVMPWPPQNLTEGPDQRTVTALDVSVMVCPTFNSTVYRNRMGVPVFRWQHAGTFPNLNYFKWLGAYHASDIPMTFGTYHLVDGIANTTQFEIDVSKSMQDHLFAFVKDPYNGPQTIGWNPMVASDPHGGELIRFGADGIVSQVVDGVDVDGVCQGIGEYNPFP